MKFRSAYQKTNSFQLKSVTPSISFSVAKTMTVVTVKIFKVCYKIEYIKNYLSCTHATSNKV